MIRRQKRKTTRRRLEHQLARAVESGDLERAADIDRRLAVAIDACSPLRRQR